MGTVRNLGPGGHTLESRCALNPYEAPRAELFWMSPQERLQARLELSARRWAVLAALAGTAQVAATSRPGPAFLLAHGTAACLCLVAGAWLAVQGAPRWLRAPGPRWAAGVARSAVLLVAAGLAGVLGAAALLDHLGHRAPFGPLARLGSTDRGLLLASACALALSATGAWALAWRWRLRRPR